MGGIIIILAILIPTLLLADLTKVYVQLMLISTVWMGIIGFIDDYLKWKGKRDAQQKERNIQRAEKMDWQGGLRFSDRWDWGL